MIKKRVNVDDTLCLKACVLLGGVFFVFCFFSFLLSFCIIAAVWPYFQIQLNSIELS